MHLMILAQSSGWEDECALVVAARLTNEWWKIIKNIYEASSGKRGKTFENTIKDTGGRSKDLKNVDRRCETIYTCE